MQASVINYSHHDIYLYDLFILTRVCLFLLSYVSLLYILDINHLSDI